MPPSMSSFSICMQMLEFAALSGLVVQGNMKTFLRGNVVDQSPISSRQLHNQPLVSPQENSENLIQLLKSDP
jgi:hypothetical protein